MSEVEIRTKVLNTIDLTGEKPVVGETTVQEKVAVIDVENAKLTNEVVLEKKPVKQCKVCLKEYPKYTCPGCQAKTCSLSCVTQHKKKTGCTGMRDKVKFIPKKEFNNMHLLNDLRFLEEANRIADNASRDHRLKAVKKVTVRERLVQKAAKSRNCKLYRMAKGMLRFKQNRSFYNTKEDILRWTVKFVFDEIYETIIKTFSEQETFESILSSYTDKEKIEPEKKIRFREYIERKPEDDILVFYRHELEPAPGNKRYSEVSIKSTLREALENKSILEYPEFRVVLSSNAARTCDESFIPEPCHPYDSGESDTDSSSENDDMPPSKKSRLPLEAVMMASEKELLNDGTNLKT